MNYDELSQIYNAQYDGYRDDLHFYGRVCEGEDHVLEVGAGTGRVTCYLARRGVRVTGLEPSGEMLAQARDRATAGGLNVSWLQGTAASLQTDERFSLIIAPFNAFMHLYTHSEQLESLQNLRAHLAPKGRLVFDLSVPNYGLTGVLRHEGETMWENGLRKDVFLLQRIDRVAQMVTTEYFVDTTAEGGALSRQHFTLTQRYFTRHEVEWLLRAAGFASPKVSGSFQGGPLDEHSEVMVFQAPLG